MKELIAAAVFAAMVMMSGSCLAVCIQADSPFPQEGKQDIHIDEKAKMPHLGLAPELPIRGDSAGKKQ